MKTKGLRQSTNIEDLRTPDINRPVVIADRTSVSRDKDAYDFRRAQGAINPTVPNLALYTPRKKKKNAGTY